MPQPSFVEWLMAAKTPSIRYLTARDLLGQPESSLQAARHTLMSEGIVPALFAKQTASGQWMNERNYYSPKYVSTHWSLLLLTELGVDPTDTRFQRGVEYMLAATEKSMRDLLAQEQRGLSCLWGNVLHYGLYAGRAGDPRLQAIQTYVVNSVADGCCHCPINDNQSCAWGVVRSLWGLTAIPHIQDHLDLQPAISQSLRFLLESFNLVEANYPTAAKGKIHPLWFKLNFPLFYQVDILFTLRVLALLDALDHPRAAAALNWLQAQRRANGQWRGSSPYRQRTWSEFGDAGETARWVSLQAALVLQRAKRFDLSQAA